MIALTGGYASLLAAAATTPDFTEVADQYEIPESGIFGGSEALTKAKADVYESISMIAVNSHLAATVGTVALVIGIRLASRSAERTTQCDVVKDRIGTLKPAALFARCGVCRQWMPRRDHMSIGERAHPRALLG